jgi:hypothetical protein
MPAPKKKTTPASKSGGKAFKPPKPINIKEGTFANSGARNAAEMNAGQRKMQKPNNKEVKRGMADAKTPGTRSGQSRSVWENNEDYNRGYIAGKKELAMFMRKQGKKK